MKPPEPLLGRHRQKSQHSNFKLCQQLAPFLLGHQKILS